jgi:hypothetical protein
MSRSRKPTVSTGLAVNLFDIVRAVRRHLEGNGRLYVRMLRRQLELDDDALDEVIEGGQELQAPTRNHRE